MCIRNEMRGSFRSLNLFTIFTDLGEGGGDKGNNKIWPITPASWMKFEAVTS